MIVSMLVINYVEILVLIVITGFVVLILDARRYVDCSPGSVSAIRDTKTKTMENVLLPVLSYVR